VAAIGLIATELSAALLANHAVLDSNALLLTALAVIPTSAGTVAGA
jgi:hypothetical protein